MRHRLSRISKKLGPALFAGLLSLAASGAAHAEMILIEAGIVCPDGRDGPQEEAPNTLMGGVRLVDGLNIDLETRSAPLIPDLGIGITTLWTGADPIDVRMVTVHPPMGPDGVTRQFYERTLMPGVTNTRSYTFEFAYERVPGPWSLQIEDDTGTLLSVDFTVVDHPVSAVEAACGFLLQS